jgi:hypothetical protein
MQSIRPTAFHTHVAGAGLTFRHNDPDGRWRRYFHCAVQACGLALFAVAVAWMLVCPVWAPGTASGWRALLPTDYAITALTGWELWFAAAALLWVMSPDAKTAR